MRTRFLNLDYFTHASSNLLEFPHLQHPSLIEPSLNLCKTEEILRSDSTLSICLDLDKFPIEDALNQFFSDVLPQNLDARVEDLGSDSSQIRFAKKETELVCDDNQDSGTLELPIQKESSNQEDQGNFEMFQFETPELDFLLEEHFVSEKQEREICSAVEGIKIPLDVGNDDIRETLTYPQTAVESVYSVREIDPEYDMEEKSSHFIENDVSLETRPYLSRYPLLEVNEVTLELSESPITEELHSLFDSIARQQMSQTDNLVADGKELLGFTEIDILECLVEHFRSRQCLDTEPPSFDLMLEVEFLCPRETTHIKGDSVIDLETSDVFLSVLCPVHFQEVQILDIDSIQSSVFVVGSETVEESETCDQMFGEDISYSRSLYESIVNHELALVDDTFKLFPIPVISDGTEIWLLSTVVEESLAYLKPQSTSASDVIYLEWHLLQEDKCTHDACCKYWNMLEEIHMYSTDTELTSFDEDLMLIDTDIDSPDRSKTIEKKEIPHGPQNDVDPNQLFKDDHRKRGSGNQVLQTEPEMVSSLFNSMSQFSDLDFFLDPRKYSEASLSDSHGTDTKLPAVSSNSLIGPHASRKVKLQKLNIEMHSVELSDLILNLINNLQKVYLGILENDTNLKKKGISFPVLENLKLLRLPKQKLMDLIKNSDTALPHEDEALMPVVALYAIKEMAYYLCFYGIHSTHLYVQNLSQNFKYLRDRLSLFQSVIEDADKMVNTDITLSHPSLSEIQRILRSNSSRTDSKVLIVVDRVFLYPLKKLLTSMKISFDVLRNCSMFPNQQDPWDPNELTNLTMAALQHSDCLLTTHENVSTSFPFNKFSLIVEYGVSCASSRISTLSAQCVAVPPIHFLKTALEDFSVPKALSEGVDIPQNTAFTMEGICLPISTLHKDVKNQTVEDSLGFAPIEKKCVSAEPLEHGTEEPCSVPMSVSSMPFAIGSEQINPNMPSFPDTIIIMNAQACDKEMLISRRSSYQKILAMEKGGAQVVEREINLPVDLIFTAAMCLVWYDCINIWKKAKATGEASPSIPSWVENIATNILTSLSFAFSNCILVFEGENRFLNAIMESSDGLYAAAASLGVDIQIFCSYSSEMTDEIILNCIHYATKLNRGLYPKMFESENLAESFLTRFPSINPLSAHAILSSGGILVEFLEWSHARRVQAIGRYHVPDESVVLFNVLCAFGEHEESKSGMTECSSASSAQDSVGSISKLDSRKRQRCSMVPPPSDSTDDCYIIEPVNKSMYCNPKPPRVSQPYQSRALSRSLDASDEIEGSCPSLRDKRFGQQKCLDTSVMQDLEWFGISRGKKVYDDIMGEVINLDNCSLFDEDLPVGNARSSSRRDTEMVTNMAAGDSSSTRTLSCNRNKYPSFPTSAEIKSYTGLWSSLKDHNKKLKEDICGRTNIEADMGMLQSRACTEFLDENMLHRSNGSGQRLPSRQNLTCSYGATTLSNAINSSEPQQGSPWTTEFLNKIKEKHKMHQKPLLSGTSPTQYGFSDNMKRRSPSILNSYRYQGGSNSKKITKRKWHKPVVPPPNSSKNEKASDHLHPMWTPADKRARQTLSFMKIGPEKQSKLVWGDSSVPGPGRRY